MNIEEENLTKLYESYQKNKEFPINEHLSQLLAKCNLPALIWKELFASRDIDFLNVFTGVLYRTNLREKYRDSISDVFDDYQKAYKERFMKGDGNHREYNIKRNIFRIMNDRISQSVIDGIDNVLSNDANMRIIPVSTGMCASAFPDLAVCEDNGAYVFRGITQRRIKQEKFENDLRRAADLKQLESGKMDGLSNIEIVSIENIAKLAHLWDEFSKSEHSPLANLYAKYGTCIGLTKQDGLDGTYLPKSRMILLKDLSLARLHQGLMSFADSVLHFSQSPVFQSISRNYFHQSESQMCLPFKDEVTYRLATADYGIARFIRQSIPYSPYHEDACQIFASALPGYFAYASHDKKYAASNVVKDVVNFIDGYVQSYIDGQETEIDFRFALQETDTTQLNETYLSNILKVLVPKRPERKAQQKKTLTREISYHGM